MKRRVWLPCLGLSALCLTACGGAASSALDSYEPATINTQEDATTWANSGSAPNVYSSSTLVLGITGLNGQGQAEDTACPVRTQDGNTLIIEGGCTDSDGRKWVGSARRESEAAGSDTGRFVYDGFGYEGTESCKGEDFPVKWVFEGTVDVTGTEEETHFDVDVRGDVSGPDDDADCAVKEQSIAWDYSGTIVKDGSKQTWSGSGRMGSSEIGVATVETKDELLDSNACDSEAASGTTTILGGADTVVVTYDGATDCDTPATVQWSLNGEAKGELVGVSCGSTGSAAPAWLLLALPALVLARGARRRRSAVQSVR